MENVEYWIKNIKAHASESVHIGLVGNKTDLRAVQAQQRENGCAEGEENIHESEGEDEDGVKSAVQKLKRLNCVDFAEGLKVAEKAGIPYFETSAKDASGTNEAFMSLARTILGYERMVEDSEEGRIHCGHGQEEGHHDVHGVGLGWYNRRKGQKGRWER